MDGIYFTYPSIALSLTHNDNSIMGQSPRTWMRELRPSEFKWLAQVHSHKGKSRVLYPHSTEWHWIHICILNFWQFFLVISVSNVGLPSWLSVVKKSACQCRRHGFDPCIGKSPWRRKVQPTLIFLPGKSHGQRSLVG